MAFSVSGAFSTFRKDCVDLDPEETKKARGSRDFLIGQLLKLDGTVAGFPRLAGNSLLYGSFSRKTKIRPLDDIDFLIVLSSLGASEEVLPYGDDYQRRLRMNDKTKSLAGFLDSNGFVNSTRILNKIRDSLPYVSQYSKAEIKKNHQAVVVNLKSYPWVFDVVPAVAVTRSWDATIIHYLIPDGSGNWIRTDPRTDAKNMTDANTRNGGNLLPVMRLLKHWNGRTYNKPRLSSYYFETLVLRTFGSAFAPISLQSGLKYFFDQGPLYINSTCADPKGLGPNLDANVSYDTKQKVCAALRTSAQAAGNAMTYEQRGDTENAIAWWRQALGPNFPTYG